MKRYLLGIIFLVGLIGGMGDRVWGQTVIINTVTPNSVCAGSTVTVNYTISGYPPSTVFYVELSDYTGSFSTYRLHIDTFTVASFPVTSSVTVTIPDTISTSTNYVIRIIDNLHTANGISGSFTINALPASIPASTSFCAGTTIALTDGTTGGTWTSGTTGVATVGSSTGVVTGVLNGTSIMTYTLGTACAATTIVTVNPIPTGVTATATPNPLCVGGNLSLTGTATGASAYSWTGPGGTAISNPTSLTTASVSGVAPGNTGTYTLTTSVGSCSVTATTAVVTVNPLPAPISASTAFCAGSTITLTDGTTGGTWTSGTATVATVGISTGIVNGVFHGTSVITYSLGAGCSVTKIITVNPAPTGVTAAATPNPICVGSNLSLNGATTGGTAYSWAGPGGTAISSPTSLNTGVTTVAAGNAGTYSLTTSIGSCSVTATTLAVTVNPLPIAITASPSFAVCAGGSTITLADAATGGSWSSSNTSVATVSSSSGIVTGVNGSPTLATITYNLIGCIVTATVTVNPLPAIMTGPPPFAICVGSSITLNDGTFGGIWSSGNTAVATVSSAGVSSEHVNGAAPGTDTITYTLSTTGCLTTAVVTVNVQPGPISGTTTVCQGATTTLIDGITGGTWSNGSPGVATIGSSSGIVSGVITGSTSPVTMIVTYTLGSSCTSTKTVTVNPLPALSVGAVGALCYGSSASLTATSGLSSYNWSPTAGLSCINCNNPIATPTITTTYTVNGTNALTCVKSTTVTVTVNPLPTITVGSVGAICYGSSTSLSASGGASYIWSPGTNLSCTHCISPTASPTITTTYTVTGTDANTCVKSTAVTVTVNPLPTIAVGSVGAICYGSSTSLSATNGLSSYSWSPTAGLSCTNCYNPTASPTLTTTYTATGTDANTCVKSTTVTVTVNPLPTIGITPVSFICAGGSATLTATGGVTYRWSPTTALTCTTCASPTSSPTITTTYTVTGTNTNVCTNTATVNVTVKTIAVSPSNTGIACVGGAINLSSGESGTASGVTYLWRGPAGYTSALNNPLLNSSVTTAMGGIYTVTATSSGSGCIATDTTIVTVNTLTVSPSNSSPACIGGTVNLLSGESGTAGGITYSWSGPASYISNSSGPTISTNLTAAMAGTYTILVTAPGVGCTATAITAVTVNTLTVSPTNNSPICAGGTVNLLSGENGTATGVTYLWDGPASLSSSISAPILSTVTTAMAGTYTVTVTAAGSGCSMMGTTTVTVNPLPAAPSITTSPPTTLCSSTMYQNFGTSAPPAGTYNWTATNAIIWAQDSSSHNNCLVNFSTPGVVATITLTDSISSTRCTSKTSSSITVTVNATSTAQPDSVINFESNLICLQNERAGITYLWGYDVAATLIDGTLNGGNDTNQNYYYGTSLSPDTLYWVKTTDINTGCFEKSYYHAPDHNKGSNTNTNNGGLGEMKVYPNPAGSYLDVQFDNIENNVAVQVLDVMGREMLMVPVQSVQTAIDISGLQPAVYFLVCYLNGVKVADSRFVKN